MAVSVQGWRKKWFYIKDQKAVPSDKFGITPFDVSKSLTKLTSWDFPPTEAEVEEIKPLLTRIQSLKSAAGRNSWRSSRRGASSPSNLEFPNYGLTLARPILLECPVRTWRKRVSTNGYDL
jgi:hypothetical protein